MKKYIAKSTNTSNVFVKPDVINAADEEVEDTLDDKISKVEDDFDYIMDGISQLDLVQGNEVLNDLNDTMQEFIQRIAGELA